MRCGGTSGALRHELGGGGAAAQPEHCHVQQLAAAITQLCRASSKTLSLAASADSPASSHHAASHTLLHARRSTPPPARPPARQVAMHTEYYTRPRLQRHVIRILWMVPIYSLDAWLALRFKDARAYLDPVREIYEAYVIYNFYAYLMNFLEDELGLVDEHLAKKAPLGHIWPFNHCLPPWRMGQEYIWETKKVARARAQAQARRQDAHAGGGGRAARAACMMHRRSPLRRPAPAWCVPAAPDAHVPLPAALLATHPPRCQGVTSYVIIRPLCTALALVTSRFGVYDEGSLNPERSYPYLAMATNLSQARRGAARGVGAAAAAHADGGCVSCLTGMHRARCYLSPSLSFFTLSLSHTRTPQNRSSDACKHRPPASSLSLPPSPRLPTPCCSPLDVGALLPRHVLPRLQGRAGAHPAARQVRLHQGRRLPHILAGPVAQHPRRSRRHQGAQQRRSVLHALHGIAALQRGVADRRLLSGRLDFAALLHADAAVRPAPSAATACACCAAAPLHRAPRLLACR